MGGEPIQCRSTEHDEQHGHDQKQGEDHHEQHGHGAQQQPVSAALEVVRLIESAQNPIDAARRIEEHEEESETGDLRMDPIGDQVGHGLFHQSERIAREIGSQCVKQTGLEVFNGHERQEAQQDEDDRENGHEDLEGDGRCPDAERPFGNAHHEEAEDVPGAHALKPPRVEALQGRDEQPPQGCLHHPRFPRLLAHA